MPRRASGTSSLSSFLRQAQRSSRAVSDSPRSQTKFRILHSRKLADDRPYRIRWGRGERQSGLGHCAYRLRKRIKLTPHRVPFLPFFQFAPVSGEVLSINQELGDQPSLLNKSPEDKGTVLAMVLFPFRLRRMDQVGFSN